MQLIHTLALVASSMSSTQASSLARRQSAQPSIPCASITAPAVPGATVVSINATERLNVAMPSFPFPGMPINTSNKTLNICDVNVTLTHNNAGDRVRVQVWLPLQNWNGRFQGTGGGGFVAGTFGLAMAPQVADGYAAASTDAGIDLGFDGTPVSPNSSVSSLADNEQLFTNFAQLSVHEMAVVGKAVTETFYGKAPSFSYWNGCSTGGRQGMMEAQMFPTDYDGILAEAPAINWPQFVPAETWPSVVMNSEGEVPPAVVFEFITAEAVTVCDANDGARDGLISDPVTCKFDAKTVVGRQVSSKGVMTTITEKHATIYNKILDGPRDAQGNKLWFGLLPGASPAILASSARPFSIAANWINNFIGESTSFNISDLNTNSFGAIFSQSGSSKLGGLIATNNPDLSQFKAAGGKMLTWHGLADQLIFPEGTFQYRERVQSKMGSGDVVDEFWRVFSAPGVQHCSGGTGPQPTKPLDILVSWVEKGQAPDTLPAATVTTNGTRVTRNLCRYPSTLKYSGSGDVNSASSWTCVNGTGITQLTPSISTTPVRAAAAMYPTLSWATTLVFGVFVWVVC